MAPSSSPWAAAARRRRGTAGRQVAAGKPIVGGVMRSPGFSGLSNHRIESSTAPRPRAKARSGHPCRSGRPRATRTVVSFREGAGTLRRRPRRPRRRHPVPRPTSSPGWREADAGHVLGEAGVRPCRNRRGGVERFPRDQGVHRCPPFTGTSTTSQAEMASRTSGLGWPTVMTKASNSPSQSASSRSGAL